MVRKLLPLIFTIALILGDTLSFILGFYFAYLVRFETTIFNIDEANIPDFGPLIGYSIIVFILIGYFFRLYSNRRSIFDVSEFLGIIKALFITFFFSIATTFLFKTSIIYSRIIIILTFVFALIMLMIFRYRLRSLQGFYRKKSRNKRKAIIVGEMELAKLIKNKILDYPELGYEIIQSIHVDSFEEYIDNNSVDIAFISVSDTDEEIINDIILNNDQITFKFVPEILNTIAEPVDFYEFSDIPVITIKSKQSNILYPYVKRGIDIIISFLGIILLSPLFFLIYCLISIIDRVNPIFSQERLGKNLMRFKVHKFRSMVDDAEGMKSTLASETNNLFKLADDPRTTTLGRLLRRSCLDELPQLINIFKGEMSLVGPRPHLETELEHYVGWREKRFEVKPGLTGLWQVSGRHELLFDRSVALDLLYIKNMSFSYDMMIIIKTIPSIIFSRGKW